MGARKRKAEAFPSCSVFHLKCTVRVCKNNVKCIMGLIYNENEENDGALFCSDQDRVAEIMRQLCRTLFLCFPIWHYYLAFFLDRCRLSCHWVNFISNWTKFIGEQ